MNFNITNKDYKKTVLEYIERIEKYPFNLTVEAVKQLKTKKQLGFIFGGLMKALRQYYFDIQGELWEADDLKDWLYNKIGVFEIKHYPDGEPFKKIKTLSDMTKEEVSEFINKVIGWIENNTDCVLPPELRNCWLLHITDDDIFRANQFNFPERNPTYLAYLRKLSCLNCGKYGCEVHHVKLHNYSGTSRKSPDWLSIPICHDCHIGKVHQSGQSEILLNLNIYDFDIEIYCKLAYLRWLYKK